MTMTPFADDAASIAVGKLTIENGTSQVTLYGSLDIMRDQQGLAHARALLAIVQAVVHLPGGGQGLAVVDSGACQTENSGKSIQVGNEMKGLHKNGLHSSV